MRAKKSRPGQGRLRMGLLKEGPGCGRSDSFTSGGRMGKFSTSAGILFYSVVCGQKYLRQPTGQFARMPQGISADRSQLPDIAISYENRAFFVITKPY